MKDKKEYFKKYYQEHREHYLKLAKDYAADHKEGIAEYQHKYWLTHRGNKKIENHFCEKCGAVLDNLSYNSHYCSRECYVRSFDKYK
jgi:hypothetical protein